MIEAVLFTATQVSTFLGSGALTHASGFFFTRDERLFLVTSRHVLIDEPTEGLAPKIVDEIFVLMEGLRRDGIPILLVEQNAKIALETAHYGYVLEIGRVVMNDTCERLMSSPDIQEFYLGAKEAGARGERRWKKKKTWR